MLAGGIAEGVLVWRNNQDAGWWNSRQGACGDATRMLLLCVQSQSRLSIVIACVHSAFCRKMYLLACAVLILALPVLRAGYVVVDTTQEGCWDDRHKLNSCPSIAVPYYGQDSQFTTKTPSYQVLCGWVFPMTVL